MNTAEASQTLSLLFSELVQGAGKNGYVLNAGDIGLLKSLDKIPASEASQSANDGATIAAHAQHVRYGLSLMNQWAAEGGNPFANAKWDEAWKISTVNTAEWTDIRNGLRAEIERWLAALQTPREVQEIEFNGMFASVVHLAYHLGAIRQINKSARGPRQESAAT